MMKSLTCGTCPEEGRHDTSASKFIYIIITYFSACLASRKSQLSDCDVGEYLGCS